MRKILLIAATAAMLALVAAPGFAGAASSTAWKVYNYNPSGQALQPVAATSTAAGNATFNFQQNVYTAQLLTAAKAYTGDRTGNTMTATVTVSNAGTFVDQNGGGCTPDNQTVRLFFSSPGFAFTNFWWSNPISYQLANGTLTLSVILADLSQWSDWNGQVANSSVSVTAGFNAAVAKVSQAGVSFGGGCFFENGVTTSDGSGTFALTGFSD
jgi:hypothetical protein